MIALVFLNTCPDVRRDSSRRGAGHHLGLRLCLAALPFATGLGCGDGSEDEPDPPDVPTAGADTELWKQVDPPASGSEPSSSSDSCGGEAYRACDANPQRCAELGANTHCSSYTHDPANSFCAPYCTSDDACPTLPGFKAACNFAWCALLCEQDSCPRGMVCMPEFPFVDAQGHDRGSRDVCVPSPGT